MSSVPLRLDHGVHIRVAGVDGRPRWALLDTGSAGGVGVGPDDPWIAHSWVPVDQQGVRGGFFLRDHVRRMGVMPYVDLGPVRVTALPLSISEGHEHRPGILGIRVLHEFDGVIFDWYSQRVWLLRGTSSLDAAREGTAWAWMEMWKPGNSSNVDTSSLPRLQSRQELEVWLADNGIPPAAMQERVWQSEDGTLLSVGENSKFPSGGVRLAAPEAQLGRVWIQASIDNDPRPMVLDTGAQRVWLTLPSDAALIDDARRRRWLWMDEGFATTGTLRPPVRLGPVTLDRVSAAVPSRPVSLAPAVGEVPAGVIGVEALARYPVMFDFRSGRVGFWLADPRDLSPLLENLARGGASEDAGASTGPEGVGFPQ